MIAECSMNLQDHQQEQDPFIEGKIEDLNGAIQGTYAEMHDIKARTNRFLT